MRSSPFIIVRRDSLQFTRPVRDVRPLIVFASSALAALIFLATVWRVAPSEQVPRTLGFLFWVATVALLTPHMFTRGGKILLDPFSPASFYSIFFAAYYLLPSALLLMDADVSNLRYIELGAAIALAFFCFNFACKVFCSPQIARPILLNELEARALLLVCWGCMALIALFFYWRVKNGHFYAHANDYTVGTDLTSSLFENFVQHLHLPVILLCGLVAASPTTLARRARLSLFAFVTSSFLLFLAASLFRHAVTLLPLAWVADNLFRRAAVPWRTSLKMVTLGLCALVLIFTVRASSNGFELANSNNQLADVIRGIANGELADTSKLADATLADENTASRGRAVSPLLFLSDVFEAMDSPTSSFGFGRTFLYELSETVPRLLWPDKPTFLSTQILIRQSLGMSLVDNSPHPLLQFYYEFGWPGIAVGFFLMGALMQYIVRNTRTVFMFFVLAFAWTAYIQVEVGLFLNLLVLIRAALILYAAWQSLLFVLEELARHRRPYRSTAMATAFPPPRQSAATPLRTSRRIIS